MMTRLIWILIVACALVGLHAAREHYLAYQVMVAERLAAEQSICVQEYCHWVDHAPLEYCNLERARALCSGPLSSEGEKK